MTNQKIGYLLLIPSIILGLVLFNANSRIALSAASHIVISEVLLGETGTGGADLEYIELYNPTGSSVDLTGWRLTRKTSTGTQGNLVASMSGSIAPHGYYLIGSQEWEASRGADLAYSTTTHIASNNTVVLYSDAGTTVVDKLGMGDAIDNEATTAANPASGKSLERKATASSTTLTMMIGGSDSLEGNGEDTDNNGNDFVLREVPQPQTKSSSVEPTMSSPSATPTSTASASASATPSASPTPSATASATPTATPSNSPSPSASASATPSATPTPSPSITPTASASSSSTPTASPTVKPSMSPTPSASPRVIIDIDLGERRRVCTISYKTKRVLFLTISIPKIECFTVKN